MKNSNSVSAKKHWYAVYTKARWEKKVDKLLTEKGITSYCPLTKVRRQWSDRIKIVEEPLFKSYVFLHIREAEKTEVRLTSGIVNFVYWQGKPAVIKDEEIEVIKRFLKEYENVRAEPLELKPGQKVRVTDGVMMNMEGSVIKVMKNRAEVVLYTLGYKLVAQLEKKNLEIL
jgi:transcription antitermination factor NusG